MSEDSISKMIFGIRSLVLQKNQLSSKFKVVLKEGLSHYCTKEVFSNECKIN